MPVAAVGCVLGALGSLAYLALYRNGSLTSPHEQDNEAFCTAVRPVAASLAGLSRWLLALWTSRTTRRPMVRLWGCFLTCFFITNLLRKVSHCSSATSQAHLRWLLVLTAIILFTSKINNALLIFCIGKSLPINHVPKRCSVR